MKKITLLISCIIFSGAAQSANASRLEEQWIQALSCDSRGPANGYNLGFLFAIDSQEWMMQQFESKDQECISFPEGVFFYINENSRRCITDSLARRFDGLDPVLLALFLKHKLIDINDNALNYDYSFVSLLERAWSTKNSSFSSDYLERAEVLLAFGADPSTAWDNLKDLLQYVEQVDLCYSNQQAGNCWSGLGLSIDIPNMRHLLKLYKKYGDRASLHFVSQGLAFRPFYQKEMGFNDPIFQAEGRKNKERYERRKTLVIEEMETPLHIAVRAGNKSMVERLLLIRKKQMEKKQQQSVGKEPNVMSLERMAKRMALDTDQDQQDGPAAAVARAPRSSVQDLRERMRAQRERLSRKIDQKRQEDSQQ